MSFVPNVKYRIQSVDFLTYLELLDPSATPDTDVRLRPAKETGRQYWQFEKNGSGYCVKNVENNNQCLYLPVDRQVVRAGKAPTIVKVLYQGGTYRLAFDHDGENHYFCTANIHRTAVRVTTSSNLNLDAQKWQLVPVTSQPIHNDVLQTGGYRFRNLNSKSLLTMSKRDNNSVYVRSRLDQSPFQDWAVIRQESGLYTIRNAGNNSYLGCSAASAIAGDSVVGLQATYLWDIISAGGYAWFLRIPEWKVSIGVGNNKIENGNEVNLVHSDNASGQTWLVEKIGAQGTGQTGQDKVHAKREVREGKYRLQSAIHNSNHEPTYMTVQEGKPAGTFCITPGTADTSLFELKYVGEKLAYFTLTYVTTTTPALFVADFTDCIKLITNEESTQNVKNYKGKEFVLLEKNEGEPGYVICRHDSGRPLRVVSGRVHVKGGVDKAVFSVDNKVAGNAMQMWMLVPAS